MGTLNETIKRYLIYDLGPFFMALATLFYLIYSKIWKQPIYLVLMISSVIISVFFVIWTLKLIFGKKKE